MKNRGVSLVELLVSVVILSVAALAVTATISFVNSKEVRSAGGSSLDLQALSFARETLDHLRNAVSSNATVVGLIDNSYTPPCAAGNGTRCGAGTFYNETSSLPASDLSNATKGHNALRGYWVWDISSGNATLGNDVAYKEVKTVVTWTD